MVGPIISMRRIWLLRNSSPGESNIDHLEAQHRRHRIVGRRNRQSLDRGDMLPRQGRPLPIARELNVVQHKRFVAAEGDRHRLQILAEVIERERPGINLEGGDRP